MGNRVGCACDILAGCPDPGDRESERMDATTADNIFDAADTDCDGLLTQEELGALLRSRGHPNAATQQLLSTLDTDADGCINRNEWRAGFYKGLPVLMAMLPRLSGETFDDLLLGSCAIPKTEERAIALYQLRLVYAHIEQRCVRERWTSIKGDLITPEQVTLYDAAGYVIKPCTLQRKCSLVEVMATGPQRPAWFVSHWWGEPVFCFLRCLEQHSFDHGLGAGSAYWVCAYANNQHSIEDDVTADPRESSFVKAINLADGRVLSVLDVEGITYTRVWCCLEIYFGLSGTYEMYTAGEKCEAYDHTEIQSAVEKAKRTAGGATFTMDQILEHVPIINRCAVGITDGPCGQWGQSSSGTDYGEGCLQAYRQASFPLALMQRAFNIRVQSSNATVADDKTRILNSIAGRRGNELVLPVVETCAEFEEVNARLHGAFAAAAFRLLLEAGEDMQACASRLAASGIQKLGLSFINCTAFTDTTAELLVASLPPTLQEIRFTMARSSATAAGSRAVLDGVVQRIDLSKLRVFEFGESLLPGSIPEWFGHCIALESLQLGCNQLLGQVPKALGMCIAIKSLILWQNHLTGYIPKELGLCVALEFLGLDDNQLTGGIPDELGQCKALKRLYLNNNQLSGIIPEALGQCTALNRLRLAGNQLTYCEYGGIPEALYQRRVSGLLELSL